MNTETVSSLVDASQPSRRSFARFLPVIARVLLGLPLVIFGLNGFLNFIPPPPEPLPEKAMAFAGALVESGYMMPLIETPGFARATSMTWRSAIGRTH